MGRSIHVFYPTVLCALIIPFFISGCNCGDTGSFDRCIPVTCSEAGKNCGTIDDGCGETIHCGYCASGYVCGINEPNVCGYTGDYNGGENGTGERRDPLEGCIPQRCVESGLECGSMNDGCGNETICGFCGSGMSCGGGNDHGRCGISVCSPETCESLSAECGQIPDGCGGILNCGSCGEGECGGGGAYSCGTGTCDPDPDCGTSCGFVSDGCSGVILCPDCEGGELCALGQCIDGADSIGNPCSGNNDCDSGHCLTESATGWRNGYCTSPCGSSQDCGEGNICGYLNENGSGICLAVCNNDANCRDGYVCTDYEGYDERVCIPGGTGTGTPGSPCSTSADCAGHADGFCLRDEDGFPGGYCTQSCGMGKVCPEGTACAFDSAGRGICVKLCNSREDCDGDYRCRNLGGGIMACWPGGNTGDWCNEHEDCATDACLSPSPHGWPGGYCTEQCESHEDCSGGSCLPLGPNGQNICTKDCFDSTDCRQGYECVTSGGGRKSCVPYGNGDGEVGDPCTTTLECSGGAEAICVSTPAGGRCSRRCSSNSQCPSGEICITDEQNQVVPGFCALPDPPVDMCSEDSDCSGTMICVTGPTGTMCADPCDSQDECRDGTVCTSDEAFGGNGFCQESSGGSSGGGGGPGDPCRNDGDCDSRVCITESSLGWPGGFCVEYCQSDSDCGENTVCEPQGPAGIRICMEICSANRDCRDGYECKNTGSGRNVCGPESGNAGPGQSCSTTSDCNEGLVCVEHNGERICATPCTEGTDCGEGMACRPTGDSTDIGTCQEGFEHECSTDADCQPGYVCGISLITGNLKCLPEDSGGMDWHDIPPDFPMGDTPTGDPCTDGMECERMVCILEKDQGWPGGYCAGSCSSTDECMTGSVCGLKRVYQITTTSSGGFDIRDVTSVVGFEPGYGVTISTAALGKIILRLILRWLLDELFGDFDSTISIGQCLAECSGDSDCRNGYRCLTVDADGAKACIPYAGGTREIGQSCQVISDCSGGRAGYCIMESGGYPGGYCSVNCITDTSSCPEHSRCVTISDDVKTCMHTTACENLGASCGIWRCDPDPECWFWEDNRWNWNDNCCDSGQRCSPTQPCSIASGTECTAQIRRHTGFCSTCTGDYSCRTDYACFAPDNGPGVCFPSAKGSRGVGERCTRLRDCAGGVDGTCFREEITDDNEPPAWPGGYCSRQCGSCPSGSTCVELVTGDNYCLETCYGATWWRSAKNCRDGYVCHDRGWFRSNACVYDPEIVHR